MATFGPSALNCGPVHLTGKTLCSAQLQTSVPSMVSARMTAVQRCMPGPLFEIQLATLALSALRAG